MEEVIICRLGDILNFRRGHDLPKVQMKKGTIPVAGSNGIIGFHNQATPISPCITIGRSGNIGTPYIYNRCWAHNTVLYIDDFKGNDPLYLYYLLKTLPLSSFSGGSAVPTLNRNHIHPIEIKFHKDINIQKKIAAILSSLDDKIELNRRINGNLEQQAQALFKSWFVDFEPFKGGEFVESKLGRIPKELTISKIGDIPHKIESGKRPKGGATSEGIPSIGAENIKGLGFYDYSKTKYIPKDFASITNRGKISGYELLIYKDGGKPGYFIPNYTIFGEGFPFEYMFINEHVFLLDLMSREYNIFAYFYMQTSYIMNQLNSIGGKAAIPGINTKDIESLPIFTDDNKKVKEFGKIVLPMITTILKNSRENAHLTKLRNTLLPRLMSGELKINDLNR